jgi:hypothetical protein
MMPRKYRWTRLCGFVALAVLLVTSASGCGGGKGNVSGEVTVGGKPLPMGIITFTPATGSAVSAEIVDGKYNAVGVPVGTVNVSLDLSHLKELSGKGGPQGGAAAMAAKFGKGEDEAKQKSMHPEKASGMPAMPEGAKEYFAKQKQASADTGRKVKDALALLPEIPQKYTDPKQSGWTLNVSKGDNTFDAKVTK